MGNAIIGRGGPADNAKVGEVRYTMRKSLGEKWALCNGDTVTGDISPELYEKLSDPMNATSWKDCILDASNILYIFNSYNADTEVLYNYIIRKVSASSGRTTIALDRINDDMSLTTLFTNQVSTYVNNVTGAVYINRSTLVFTSDTGNTGRDSYIFFLSASSSSHLMYNNNTGGGLMHLTEKSDSYFNNISLIPTPDNEKVIVTMPLYISDDEFGVIFRLYDSDGEEINEVYGHEYTARLDVTGFNNLVYPGIILLHYAISNLYTVALYAIYDDNGWYCHVVSFDNDGAIIKDNLLNHCETAWINNSTSYPIKIDGSVLIQDDNNFIIHISDIYNGDSTKYLYTVSTNTLTQKGSTTKTGMRFINSIQKSDRFYILCMLDGDKSSIIYEWTGNISSLYNNSVSNFIPIAHIKGNWRSGAYVSSQDIFFVFDGNDIYVKQAATLPLYDESYNVFMKIKN